MKPLPSPRDLVEAVKKADAWAPERMLPFEATEDDCAAALRCIQDDPIGHGGLDAFERELARITGIAQAVGVASGTAALELALRAVGVIPGDEVIVPAMTFAGAAAAVVHCGAVPRFVDCLYYPFGAVAWFKLDRHLRALGEDRRRIKAVIVADLLGHVGVTPELSLLCEEFGLKLIEDGAQALGSMTAGFQADVMTLSFNNNKIVTTTGGGAVLTNDAELAERVRHLATTAKKDHPHRYDYDAVGHNYRLPNVLAAIGVPQLARLEQIIARKHRLHQRYVAAFTNVSGFKLVSHGVSSNAWLNCVLVDPPHGNGTVRDMMLAALTRAGFGCRAMFTPMHMLEPYKGCPRQDDLGIAEEIFYRAVCLPSGVEP